MNQRKQGHEHSHDHSDAEGRGRKTPSNNGDKHQQDTDTLGDTLPGLVDQGAVVDSAKDADFEGFTPEEIQHRIGDRWHEKTLEIDAEGVTASICDGVHGRDPFLKVEYEGEEVTQALTSHGGRGGHNFLHYACCKLLLIGVRPDAVEEILMAADFLIDRDDSTARQEIKRELRGFIKDGKFTPKLKTVTEKIIKSYEGTNNRFTEEWATLLLEKRYGEEVTLDAPDIEESWKGGIRRDVVEAALSSKPRLKPKTSKASPAEILADIFGMNTTLCMLDGPKGTTAHAVKVSDLKDLPDAGAKMEYYVPKILKPAPWTTNAGVPWCQENEFKTAHSLKINENFDRWGTHVIAAEYDKDPEEALQHIENGQPRAKCKKAPLKVQWQMITWVSDQIKQTPVYVCRSGGDDCSLHAVWECAGWETEDKKALYRLLFSVGFDPVTANHSQKVRVPGGTRRKDPKKGGPYPQKVIWRRKSRPDGTQPTEHLHKVVNFWLSPEGGTPGARGLSKSARVAVALPRPPAPPKFDSLKAFSDWHEENGSRLTEETCLQVAGANSKIMYVETPLNAWLSAHYGLGEDAMPLAAFRGLANAADVRRQSQLAQWMVSTGDYCWCDNRYYKAKPGLGVEHLDKDALEAELKAGGIDNTTVVAAFKTAVRTHFGASAVVPRHFAPQGISEVNGKRLLNSSEVYLVPPAGEHSGKWADGFPLIAGVIDSLFRDQKDYFNRWLAHLVRSCYAGEPKAGLAMMLLGPKSAGKKALRVGILQQIFLGGGMVDAGSYLSGETHFNARLGEAVFAFASDFPVEGKNIDKFGARVKELVGEARIVVEKKCIDSIEVEQPCVRALVFANADEKSLKGVPKLTENTEDKVALLRMHLPSGVTVADHPEDYELEPEIPAFIAYLLSSACDVPEDQTCPRFGLTVMHDTALLERTIEAHDDGLLGLIEGVAEDMGARWDDDMWEQYFSEHLGQGGVIWEKESRYLLVNDQALYDLLLHGGSEYAKARVRKPSEVKNALTDVITSHRDGLIQRDRRRLKGKRVRGYLIKISKFDPSLAVELDEPP